MNRYILIHRLTGPAVLLLLGIVALLSEMHLMHFVLFFPLLLILLGVLKLAERAALAGWENPEAGPQGPGATTYGGTQPYGPSQPYGSAYGPPGYGSGPADYGSSTAATGSTSIVPTHELGNGGNDAGEGKL